MTVPKEIKSVVSELKKQGFEAYVVGGCVRDLLRDEKPEDWDIATNAKPEEIQKIMEKTGRKTFYENEFWTVGVIWEKETIEITTYRAEAKYSDKRHPDEIRPAKNLGEDLARRDFTINAMAADVSGRKIKIVDPFSGQKDLKGKVIRAVGAPKDRFSEDALRMMRAVRFASVLGFAIEPETLKSIGESSPLLKMISQERIRDELVKIIMSDNAAEGIDLLRETGLLKHVLPELEEGFGNSQNKHHIYDCYQHSLLSLKYAAKKKFNKFVRIASLLHDIGKPRSKRGEGPDATFYGHEIIGAKMTNEILNRLKFPKKEVEKITKLVRYHLFYYNAGEVSESSVRRLVRNAGPENMEELLQVRMADRIGSGVPKAEPYKLRHLKYIIEKVSQDPISAKMLKISGDDIMKVLGIKPGPKVGRILDILLGEVLADPKKNKKEVLEKQAEKLGGLSDKELDKIAKESKEERNEIETKRDEMTKQKYWVS